MAIGLWLALELLTDRVWPVTLLAFGPRWLATLPILPLGVLIVALMPGRIAAAKFMGLVALTGVIVVIGIMDFRLGLGRVPGSPALRIMTHNVGESVVTAAALDRFMKTELVDVAALQECPFYNNDMERIGWRFFYGGDLCLVSRYPFSVLDQQDPENAWKTIGSDPYRFEIETPLGPLQLLNVHLKTIREGLEALGARRSEGLSELVSNREGAAVASRSARARLKIGTDPIVVVGDFNLPIESTIYRTNWGDFQNAFSNCGVGFGNTKFTPLFGIRIDHVLTSGEWRCVDARVLPSPYGGDHEPLLVDLVHGI
jgi:hypothetical protein